MRRQRHTVSVQKRKSKTGSANQKEYENDGAPVIIPGTYHPLSAEEILVWGTSTRETGKFFCRSWPGDIHSRITFRGAQWDQVAPAEISDIGQNTKHVVVVLRRR